MDITKAVAEGKIAEKGNVLSYSLASGATSITDLSVITEAMQKTEEATAKWEEIKSYIADLEEKIANQTIVVVNAQEGETFDPATCPNVTMK